MQKHGKAAWSFILGLVGFFLGILTLCYTLYWHTNYAAYLLIVKDFFIGVFFLFLAILAFRNFWLLVRRKAETSVNTAKPTHSR